MLILAFDTSGFAGSIALLHEGQVLAERQLDAQLRSAQTLAPAIADLLQSMRLRPSEIELVATTIGPGSFTGLRVGITTAKTFAYAVGAQVIGVSTLEAIAHQVPAEALAGTSSQVHAVLNAQRNNLFVGTWGVEQDSGNLPELTRLEPDRLVSASAWLATLRPGTVVSGSGLPRWRSQMPEDVHAVDQTHWEPRAATVGRLAWHAFQRGERDDLWRLAPVYLRTSAAEEKAAQSSASP